jgi:hypothetical protein
VRKAVLLTGGAVVLKRFLFKLGMRVCSGVGVLVEVVKYEKKQFVAPAEGGFLLFLVSVP